METASKDRSTRAALRARIVNRRVRIRRALQRRLGAENRSGGPADFEDQAARIGKQAAAEFAPGLDEDPAPSAPGAFAFDIGGTFFAVPREVARFGPRHRR